ncbi:flavin-containing monooxygenase [Tsuneonella aeria]|nr:NAD(P)/FAD-dependent oxidoreductase [Tsuneonella aeria]
MRFLMIGAGMSGILAAIKLREAGHDDVIVLEKADQLGGTWRDNRYPGLTCDVPAHAYTYSFAPNPEWSRFFAGADEIRAYFEKVARDHGILPLIRFNREVIDLSWEGGEWRAATGVGEDYVADVVIVASGPLHHPRMPDIEGLESFAGQAMHTARWDDSVALDGKRVGVIGCGSTGVQMVSALADRAARLVHFQRNPQWIMPVVDFAYTDAEREAFRNDPSLVDAIRYDPEYEGNVQRFTMGIIDPDSEAMHAIEELCRVNLEQSVADPVLREQLRPNYRAACKRLIYSPNYYERVQLPAVVVETGGIERIEPAGVRMKDGTLHELDVLALATGFDAQKFIRPTTVRGRDGLTLDEAWEDHASAYMAITIPDFPNMFFLNGPTSPVGNFSLIDVAERQWSFVAALIAELASGACDEISASAEAMAAYDTRRTAAAAGTIFASGCSSWYLDKNGVPMTWPWSYQAFADAMANPVLADMDCRVAARAAA